MMHYFLIPCVYWAHFVMVTDVYYEISITEPQFVCANRVRLLTKSRKCDVKSDWPVDVELPDKPTSQRASFMHGLAYCILCAHGTDSKLSYFQFC